MKDLNGIDKRINIEKKERNQHRSYDVIDLSDIKI